MENPCMKNIEPASATPALELERIVTRMQKIQRELRASGQPISLLELEELKELGRAYARIIDRLAQEPHDSGLT
jgi:hypothetical protein